MDLNGSDFINFTDGFDFNYVHEFRPSKVVSCEFERSSNDL